jgi:cytochrome P450
MIRTDSAIREGLRLRGIGSRSVWRMVVAKDGLTTEDGHHLPQGTICSMLQRAPHKDPAIFPNPEEYDSFRYSKRYAEDATNYGAYSFVSFSGENSPFGAGKHACPGRFLVDFEIKTLLAYLLLNYDIELAEEHSGERPRSVQIVEVTFAPLSARVRVRRRARSEKSSLYDSGIN